MIKAKIEKLVGCQLTDEEFKQISIMATDDIKANRIAYGQRTSFSRCIFIVTLCAGTFLR